MAGSEGMEDRIAELEVKLSFAEDLLESLNATVFRQQREIDQLRREMVALRQQWAAAMPADEGGQPREIPPHY